MDYACHGALPGVFCRHTYLFRPGTSSLARYNRSAVVPVAVTSQKLQQWVTLNWIRQALGMVALGAALHSLGRGYGDLLAKR